MISCQNALCVWFLGSKDGWRSVFQEPGGVDIPELAVMGLSLATSYRVNKQTSTLEPNSGATRGM